MRRRQHDSHGGQREQVFLIDETQLALVHWIRTKPHAKRVQHGVALGEGVLDFGNPVLQQTFVTRVIESHRFVLESSFLSTTSASAANTPFPWTATKSGLRSISIIRSE